MDAVLHPWVQVKPLYDDHVRFERYQNDTVQYMIYNNIIL